MGPMGGLQQNLSLPVQLVNASCFGFSVHLWHHFGVIPLPGVAARLALLFKRPGRLFELDCGQPPNNLPV